MNIKQKEHMSQNILYTDHLDIMTRLASFITQKNVQEADIMEWCQQAEVEFIKDMTSFWKYLNVKLQVKNNTAQLPCNVFRILDVFSSPDNNQSRISYGGNRGFIFLPDYNNDYIYINFIGTPINDDGMPMIAKGHEQACETYCLLRMFAEDSIYRKIDPNLYNLWEQKFQGQVTNIKQSVRRFDRNKMNVLNAMKYSVMRIGNLRLASNDIYQ